MARCLRKPENISNERGRNVGAMEVRNACDIAAGYGKVYRMPPVAVDWSRDQKMGWAVGVFSGCCGNDDVEIKHIKIDKSEKVYERLEIHDRSCQMYAVISGSVAVPVSDELSAKSVEFYRVKAGEAVIVNDKVWHAGAVGMDVPADVIVVLRAGTTNEDITKQAIEPSLVFRKR